MLRTGPADSANLDSDPAALGALELERLLVKAVFGKGPAIDALAEIGVSGTLVKGALAVGLAQYQLDRQPSGLNR